MFEDLIALEPKLSNVPAEIRRQLERDALYANYISRQQKDIEMLQKDEAQLIPKEFDFALLEGLSNELKGKLTLARPQNLAQAASPPRAISVPCEAAVLDQTTHQ